MLGRKTTTQTEPLPDPETFIRPDINSKSLVLRHVDVGSCNGCEVELGLCFAPIYDIESYGISLTASPRHSDGLIVTGVVTSNMAAPLMDAYRATPAPKVVIALGDCAINCNGLGDGYGVEGAVGEFLEVDLQIRGCPPEPKSIIAELRRIAKA